MTHKLLHYAILCLLLTLCTNPQSDNNTINSESLVANSFKNVNEMSNDNLEFLCKKEIYLTGLGLTKCNLIMYENNINESSEKNRKFNKIDISIKYPEFMFVIEENSGFDYELIEYTTTLNYLIKVKAIDIYLSDYGVYLAGIRSVTDYEVKFLDNNLLSIYFKTVSVESTKYTNCYAVNIDLSNNELYEAHRFSKQMDKVCADIILTPLDFVSTEVIQQQIESNKYIIYSGDGQEITDSSEKEKIIFAFKENLGSYFQGTDKFYITKEGIVFISDETSYKGDSNNILFKYSTDLDEDY